MTIAVLDAAGPLTLVYVAVFGDESAVALILVFFEPAFVLRSLRIVVFTFAFTYIGASDHLALVIRGTFVLLDCSDQIRIQVGRLRPELKRTERFEDVLNTAIILLRTKDVRRGDYHGVVRRFLVMHDRRGGLRRVLERRGRSFADLAGFAGLHRQKRLARFFIRVLVSLYRLCFDVAHSLVILK